MDGGDEEVEPHAPEIQPGEEAEGLADGGGRAMCGVPAPDEEDAEEDVDGDYQSQAAEDGWR